MSSKSHHSPGGPGRRGLEAILLVGGQGTRLRPLTIATPKPLLPTAGVPFLAHQLARAAASGVTRVLMATFYRAQMFAECLGDGSEFGLEIAYIQEEAPLDTGGAIRNAASGLRSGPDDPVVVLNGDILSGHDLPGQVAAHVKAGAAVTLHLVEVADPARFGCVPTDSDGRVTAGYRPDPPRPQGIGRAGDLSRADRLRAAGPRPCGHLVLARRRDAGGVHPRLSRPGTRRAGLAGPARPLR
jgi:ADP-glucose pyrophosphorylase